MTRAAKRDDLTEGANTLRDVADVLAEALAGRNLKPREARALAARIRRAIDALPGNTGPSGGLSTRLRAAADLLDAQAADDSAR